MSDDGDGIDLCICDGCGLIAVRKVDDLDWVDGDEGMRFCPHCVREDEKRRDALYAEEGGGG